MPFVHSLTSDKHWVHGGGGGGGGRCVVIPVEAELI